MSTALHWTKRGKGPPLLLLHGFTGVGTDWDAVFGEIVTGYTHLMPDLPGHGMSLPLDRFTFRQAARMVADDLQEMGVGPLPTMGMSGGGQVLLHLATGKPNLITSSVLVSTAAYFPVRARALMKQATADAQPDDSWIEMRSKHPGGDAQVRALFETAHGFHISYGDVAFTPDLLARVCGPCLVVHGDRDPFYPVTSAMELYTGLPQASLWVLPGAGHCPVFGEQAQLFTEVALRFLANAEYRR
ncbi:MAG: alpha/beta hydrolase [Pseudomonadota bacterium]